MKLMIGRPPRRESVKKTTIYLTRDQRIAANNIRARLPIIRNMEAESQNDIVGLSLLEFSRILDSEFIIKSATTRPRG